MSATALPQPNLERSMMAEMPLEKGAATARVVEPRVGIRHTQPLFMVRRRRDLLSRTVAEEIVPRLVLLQRECCP